MNETLALIGESGSGKSTTGRVLLRLDEPTEGRIWFEGREITHLGKAEMKPIRQRMQVVFQDPDSSLNPRMRVGDFVAEPMIVHGLLSDPAEQRTRVEELFELVGLNPKFMDRYPHEFSGGQRQRVGLARAIALKPSLIVADEPITALDVSIQAQIVNLFQDLQEQLGVAYLFIAHDLNMVRYLSHRIAVMFGGRIVEIGPTRSVFERPAHPYTRSLLSSIPIPNPRLERQRVRIPFEGEAMDESAELVPVGDRHFVLQKQPGSQI
jgi:peptide/nickel transport system ATP-binding protein